MKVLHCSDLHLDKSTAGIPRFADVQEALWQTVEAAIARKVDLYVCTGDVADPDSGPIVLRCVDLILDVASELAHNGIENWWIAGNHDVVEDGYGTTTLTPVRQVADTGMTRVFETPTVVERENWTGIALPYPSSFDPYDPAKWLEGQLAQIRRRTERPAGHKVLVAGHLTQLEGIPDGEETREMPRGKGIPFPLEQCDPSWLLVQGHWHDRQEYSRAGRTVHVCGSLARLTFGEEKNVPSFNLYEF